MRQKILQITVRRAHKKQIRKSPLQLPRRIHLPRHANQRILRRRIPIRRRIQRRSLNMRVVIRTPRRQIHQNNIQRFQQRQKLNRLRQIQLRRIARVNAKSPAIRNQFRERLRNPRTEFSIGGQRRIGTVSKAETRTPIFKLGATARIPCTTSRRNRVRFSKLPPYFPSRVCAPRNSCPKYPWQCFTSTKSKPTSEAMRPARQKSSTIPSISPSVSTGKSADKPSRRSRIGCRCKILGSARVWEFG